MIHLDHGGAARDVPLAPAPKTSRAASVAHHGWVDDTRRAGPWRVVPDLSPYLLYIREEGDRGPASRLVLVGPRSEGICFEAPGRTLCAGVRLRPGSIPRLFRLAAAELTDRGVSLDAVAPCVAERLLERLTGARPDEVLGHLWSTFDALGEPRDGDPRVEELLRCPEIRSTTPARTLHRLVRREVGLTPEQVRRIGRFHRSLTRQLRTGETWARVAAASGYCDQSHLVREYRSLMGVSPSGLIAGGRRIQDGPGETS